MEVNQNLTKLQGVLRNLLKTTGDFSKIKYKGGNEEKITLIVVTLQEYLSSKRLLIDNKVNIEHQQELQNFTRILIFNTEFKSDSNLSTIKEFSHLIKVIPTLSKCVAANLIIELDLVQYFCSIITTLQSHLGEELFSEMIMCLKYYEPRNALQYTYTSVDTIIKMLILLDTATDQNEQNGECIEKLADVVSEMLKNISGINTNWIQNWKAKQLNEHIGQTLLYLLKLLRCCPLYLNSLSRVIDDIIRVSITIMKAVTLNVFCVWAEVKWEDQPLQIAIAGEAYLVIEHLQKYKPAEELIQMLGSIAKRPKTISEIILEADTTTMISHIYECDNNQKLWFKAFMNTNVLQNDDALNCLDKWAHLCTQDDVTRLLNMSVCVKIPRLKLLVLKCANTLNLQELALVSARYFRECNTNNLDTGSVQDQLTLLFNKAESSSEVDNNFIKHIYLLLLQNPEYVLTVLYIECLKKSVYTNYLRKVFQHIKTFVEVHILWKAIFIKVLKSRPPTLGNLLCYKELLNMLLNLQYFQGNVILQEVFMPQIQEFFNGSNCEALLYTVRVLNLLSIEHNLYHNILPAIALLGNILEKSRCQFFTFSLVNQDIVQEVIDFLLKYASAASCGSQYKDFLCNLEFKDNINKFYITSIYQDLGNKLLNYVYPKFNSEDSSKAVSQLIKLLPTCVSSEWILITKDLESISGYEKLLKLLEDTFVLLCHLTNSQTKENKTVVNNSLKFCLQQYGIVIKDILQPKYSSMEEEVLLTKSICNLLKDIPNDIRKEEGLQLIRLLSPQSLRSLKQDKLFVLSLVAINDSTVSQLLAQKMLS